MRGRPFTAEDIATLLELRPYATPRQLKTIEALHEFGTTALAAEALGITPPAVRSHIAGARSRAAAKGWSDTPALRAEVGEGFAVRRRSTHYNIGPDGERTPTREWLIQEPEKEARFRALMEAVRDASEEFRGAIAPTPKPRATADDLMAAYVFGDPHVGMYAWGAETGGDSFDIVEAEALMVGAVDQLVSLAPPARAGVLINLGDYFHSDDNSGRTKRSGHALDVDGRWEKVLHVGVRIMRRCISRALEKHETVRVINARGNHDDHTAAAFSLALSLLYESEPRVEIDTAPTQFHYIEHGRTLIGVTHGNGLKLPTLGGIMAADRPEAWGRTTHRYWKTGHIHSKTTLELPGCLVESHRTLSPPDAYAASAYRSGRDMMCEVYSKRGGRPVQLCIDAQHVTRAAVAA